MQCFHPITAWRAKEANPTGKHSLVFSFNKATCGQELQVACGKCIGCRLTKSMEWAVRAVHESKLHEENAFLTLTYSPENLPEDGGLNHKHYQDFMKRYRKAYPEKKIRYMMCGEYGEKPQTETDVQHVTKTVVGKKTRKRSVLGRPHYHAAIFGHMFDDLQPYKSWNSKGKTFRLYTSEKANKLWQLGYAVIGDLTLDSAAYIARYTTKKLSGELAKDHYQKVNIKTGEIHDVIPEYVQASRRPGLGNQWWQQFKTDTYKDRIHIKGEQYKVPKYYDRLLEDLDPYEIEAIKQKRAIFAHENSQPSSRLITMEEIAERKTAKLIRKEQ
jgi:hypothetical protein